MEWIVVPCFAVSLAVLVAAVRFFRNSFIISPPKPPPPQLIWPFADTGAAIAWAKERHPKVCWMIPDDSPLDTVAPLVMHFDWLSQINPRIARGIRWVGTGGKQHPWKNRRMACSGVVKKRGYILFNEYWWYRPEAFQKEAGAGGIKMVMDEEFFRFTPLGATSRKNEELTTT